MATMQITKTNFEQEVTNSESPVLLDFWAVWCGPCKMQSPVIEEIEAEYGDRVKVGKVNVDEEPELAARYDIMSIPTLVVLKEGQVSKKAVGFQSKEAVADLIA
ncbi:thioredoxin [Lachnospiraceae bacterium ZAX-1]